MKKSWTFITLLAALAAGGASAQVGGTPVNPGTTAGTEIKNTAEITYTPEDGKEVTTPSNEVITKVLPVPSFNITPNDKENPADVSKPDYSEATPVPGYPSVKPCQKNVNMMYTLTNSGNLDNESYTLTNTPDPTGAVKSPENIRFYAKSADADGNNILSADEITAATPITTITGVNKGQSVQFFQVYDIPCTALDTDKFGGDPTGTRNDNPAFDNDVAKEPVDGNNSNTTTVTRKDGQFVGPKDDADADNKTDPANTTQNPVYTNPATPGDTTPDTVYPGGTTVPGTTTPVPNDTQQVIAPCTNGTNVVTFVNTVKNTGNRDDVIDIEAELIPPIQGATVTLLKLDGTALSDTEAGTAAADGKADVGSLAPGASASFLVRVTYDNCLSGKPTIVVTSTSSNNTSIKDKTYDELLTPVLSFGDPKPGLGGDPAPTPNVPVTIPETCTAPVNAVFPMEIANIGSAPDLYNVSGTTTIKLNSGNTVPATVTYYKDVNENGTYEAGTDTALTDTNGDGTPDTGTMAPGTELKLIALLPVPCEAAAQVITLNQVAKSPTTGVTIVDNNDTVTVGQGPVAKPVKKILVNGQLVDSSEAKPRDVITYQIIGKNTSNGNITKAMVCDTVPANTSFESFTATSDAAGTVLYSNNGGTSWTTSATAPAANQKICAAVDTNNDGQITTADILAPGKSINVTFKVTVN